MIMGINTLLENILQSLIIGNTTPKHPFRYVNLATMQSDGMPSQRLVVFRKIEGNKITIYTDLRTPKVEHLRNNPKASLLFYDYKKIVQIQLQGTVTIDTSFDKSLWDNLSLKAKQDYTSVKNPGDYLTENFEEIIFDTNKNYFCKLYFHFTKIDYLKINKPHHIRAQFEMVDNNWKGSYVVP